MKRKFWVILLALASALCLVFGLSACAGIGGGSNGSSGSSGSGKHTHHFVYIYNNDATCTEDGTETEHCDSCDATGETRVKEGTKLGHDMREVQASDATCTADGVIYHWHCNRCELNFEDEDGETRLENVITEPKFGHEMREVQGREVTCTVDGIVYHWHCDRCELDFRDEDGEIQLETVVKEMLGHDMVQLPAQEATCAECGYPAHIGCSRCGYTEESVEYTDALHVQYKLSDDYYIVSGLDSACTDTEIVIPATYKGLPVTEIGNRAFKDCDSLTSITIPESVTSIGEYAFYCYSFNRSSLESVTFEGDSQLTSIGDRAFSQCDSLTSITIPESVTSIGTSAFINCRLLQSVTFEGDSQLTSIGGDAFYGCHSLTSITIPESVSSIGWEAFQDCSSLQSVRFEGDSQLTSIGKWAFAGCSFTSIAIPASVTSIGDHAFINCRLLQSVTFEGDSQLTSIGGDAFYGCHSLTSITIPESVTSIGESAFYGCSSLNAVYITDLKAWCGIYFGHSSANPLSYAHHLYVDGEEVTDLHIPDSITKIKQYAFCGGAFRSVTIPESVTSIGVYAFSGCSSLTSITIPESVTSIGNYAFSNCSSLNAVYITDLVAWCRIDFGVSPNTNADKGFSNPLAYAHHLYVDGQEVTDLHIPDGVTEIKKYAFYGGVFTSITIPASVWQIAPRAFSGCSLLGSIKVLYGNSVYHSMGNCLIETESKTLIRGFKSSVIPNDGSVTSIGREAFYDCSSLESIAIPESVTAIGSSAFEDCSSLESVMFEGDSKLTSIGEKAFYGTALYNNDTNWVNGILYIGDYLITVKGISGTCNIREGTKVIANYAFSYCSSLTSITIPASVTSIGSSAFYRCSSLTSINIPASVTSIGNHAFWDCSSLQSAIFERTDGWKVTYINTEDVTVSDPETAARYLRSTYCSYYWERY